ncbi:MAG: hypothetical protein V4720_10615 [Pseudomonadota bacterium]
MAKTPKAAAANDQPTEATTKTPAVETALAPDGTAPSSEAPASSEAGSDLAGKATPSDQPGADKADAAAEDAAAEAKAEAGAAEVAPLVDVATLSVLERLITQLNTTGHRAGLIDELTQLYGLEIDQADGEDAASVRMMEIETDQADTLATALDNWGNAARRKIAETLA